jgi:hypothetical protein
MGVLDPRRLPHSPRRRLRQQTAVHASHFSRRGMVVGLGRGQTRATTIAINMTIRLPAETGHRGLWQAAENERVIQDQKRCGEALETAPPYLDRN